MIDGLVWRPSKGWKEGRKDLTREVNMCEQADGPYIAGILQHQFLIIVGCLLDVVISWVNEYLDPFVL